MAMYNIIHVVITITHPRIHPLQCVSGPIILLFRGYNNEYVFN